MTDYSVLLCRLCIYLCWCALTWTCRTWAAQRRSSLRMCYKCIHRTWKYLYNLLLHFKLSAAQLLNVSLCVCLFLWVVNVWGCKWEDVKLFQYNSASWWSNFPSWLLIIMDVNLSVEIDFEELPVTVLTIIDKYF